MSDSIRYTVELRNPTRCFRLLVHGGWRQSHRGEDLLDGDRRCPTAEEVADLSTHRGQLEIAGNTYAVNPDEEVVRIDSLFTNHLRYSSSAFRRDVPPMPSLDQLRAVIADGDDNITSSLILKPDGTFELRRMPPFDHRLNDPSVVLRHETFGRRTDHLGTSAAEDDRFVLRLYTVSLEHWREHLTNHVTQAYSDLPPRLTLEQARNDILEIVKNWQPDY